MPHRFDWPEYGLNGPPKISLDDYTFYSFGCSQVLDRYLDKIRRIRAKNESVRWLIVDFWGRGKSTLMYNLCNRINATMFFSSVNPLTLALFVDHPQKAGDLLDYSYQNGLPIPWKPEKPKDKTSFTRKQLFSKALRILAFAWVAKAVNDEEYQDAGGKETLRSLINISLLNQNPTKAIEDIDQAQTINRYEIVAGFLASYLRHSFSSKGFSVEDFDDAVLRYFPDLVYDENSVRFLTSYSKLLGEPQKGLRDFTVFHSLCELASIHILLVIDEAAEWDQVVNTKLDGFLIDMLPANRLSAILVSRTDVERSLHRQSARRPSQKLSRYFYLWSWTKHVTLQDPTKEDILEIAKGILATNRSHASYCMKLFPFSEGFIISLSEHTVRGGHFSSRMFVRGLSNSLRLSLDWEREGITINSNLIARPDLLDALVEDLKLEDKKGLQPLNLIEKAQEIRRKVKAARFTCRLLLSGVANPPSRYMLEIIKEVVSKHYMIPVLSDIEMFAYAKEDERTNVNQLVKGLTPQTSISQKDRDHLTEWVTRRIHEIVSARKTKSVPIDRVKETETETDSGSQQKVQTPANVTENLPKPTGFSDFSDIGRFSLYLKKNPMADDRQVAKELRLSLNRVAVLRAWYMNEHANTS